MIKNIPLLLTIFMPLIFIKCGAETSKKENEANTGIDVVNEAALEQVIERDDDGNLKIFSKIRNGDAKEGKFIRMTPDSIMIEEAYYHHDTLNGKRILFSDKGIKETVETYKKGIFDGPYTSYYPDGTIAFQGEYQNNSMEGVWRRYYQNGQVMEEVTFANNEENGPFTEYNENGTLKAKGTYLNGDNEEGELLVYDENGVLLRKMTCQNGMCKTVWKQDLGEVKTIK